MELRLDLRDGATGEAVPAGRSCEPSLADVEAALRAMDGRTRSGVTLSRGVPDAFLAAAGGGDSGYSVFLWTEDEQEWAVVSDPGAEGTAWLVAGGQEVRYPRRHVVGLDAALTAFRAYLAGTEKDPSLTWEKVSRDRPSPGMIAISNLGGWKARLAATGAAEIMRSVFEAWAQAPSADLYATAMRRLWSMSGARARTADLLQRVMAAPERRADRGRDSFVGRAWQPVALALQASAAPDVSNAVRRAMAGIVTELGDLGAELDRVQASDPRVKQAVDQYGSVVAELMEGKDAVAEALAAPVRTAAEGCAGALRRALPALARANGW